MNSLTNEHEHLYIQTLGGFSISSSSQTIYNRSYQSKKPWILLEYLIVFRVRSISSNELIETIWGDKSGSNPAASLKSLLFRSRKIMEPLGIPPQKLIVSQEGSYTWTRDIETICDIDLFDRLCREAFSPKADAEAAKQKGLQAIELYKGEFLPQSSGESWVIPLCTYYHNLYLKLIHRLLETFFTEGAFEQVIYLCQQALLLENFDEDLHYYMISAFYKSGNVRSAMEHYIHTTNLFYNELSLTPSDRLKDLYIQIQKDTHQILSDLSSIQTDLQKSAPENGAFYCEYSVFRDIYLMLGRAMERSGDSIYICLLTAGDAKRISGGPDLLARTMNFLHTTMMKNLRKGDVFSRYSVNQYILLLPSSTYENGEKVLQRILRQLKTKESARMALEVTYSLQAMLPFVMKDDERK